MKIHLFVISWEGKHDAADAIVVSATSADYRTVIYSNAAETEESGAGEWLQVPNDWFFGRKFERALRAFRSDADIFLLVQGDAEFGDWNWIVSRCREAFHHPDVGVWAPHVHHSWWTNDRVIIGETEIGSIVAQTDGIVFAFRRSTAERLLRFDYSCNNLGWGVEWAAIVHAYSEGRLAFRDQTLSVYHPPGSGYNHDEARTQMSAYVQQFTIEERARMNILSAYTTRQQGGPFGPS